MVSPTCSKCRRAIPSEDVNVANDVAYCRACNLSYKLSELTHKSELTSDLNLSTPPAGAWHRSQGVGTVDGATHRSVGGAFGALALTLFWNGIVSIFVLVAIAGTMRNMKIPLPHWFPTPDMNGSPMGVGMTIFLWIFLTPFIAIGFAFLLALLSSIAGRTEVRMAGADGVVFSGIGSIGYRRRFDPQAVKDVRIDEKKWRDSDGDRQNKTNIVIETREGRLIKFGSMLREDRRKFVAGAVRKALVR
jgi:hypothetical protein